MASPSPASAARLIPAPPPMALVACKALPTIDPQALWIEVEATFPGLVTGEPAIRTAPDSGAIVICCGDHRVMIAAIDGQIPWEELERPAKSSLRWFDATRELEAHNGHVVVMVLRDDPKAPVAWSELLQEVRLVTALAAAIAGQEGAIGVYWPRGGVLTMAAAFRDDAIMSLMSEVPPVTLWIDMRLFKGPAAGNPEIEGTGFIARGLNQLVGRDLVLKPSTLVSSDVMKRGLSIVHYLATNGPVFAHGDTAQAGPSEILHIAESNDEFGQPIFELTLQRQ